MIEIDEKKLDKIIEGYLLGFDDCEGICPLMGKCDGFECEKELKEWLKTS